MPGTGIVLNDEMDDFSVAPNQPNAFGLVDVHGTNAVAPGKRPLSSMTPTLVLEDGKVRMVAGSPGGPRIITTVLLALINVLDFGLDPSEAIAQPRFHRPVGARRAVDRSRACPPTCRTPCARAARR